MYILNRVHMILYLLPEVAVAKLVNELARLRLGG